LAAIYDTSSKEDATLATTVSKRSLQVSAIRIEIYLGDIPIQKI